MRQRIILYIFFVFAFFSGIFTGLVIYAFKDFDGIEKLEEYKPQIPSALYDVHGELISEFFIERRMLVSFDKFPPHLIKAFLAMEDNRFYEHFGVDPRGILRAFVVNLMAGRIKEGGSTITQQLSKVLLTNRERTLTRKIKEAWIAMLIERKYSKNEILTLYFNQIYLGHGAYGVEAASNFYFDKSVNEINIAEAALLSTLPSAPAIFSPFRNVHLSREKHRIALSRMAEMGFISDEESELSYHDFWLDFKGKINSPSATAWGNRIDQAPYFTEYIRRRLEPQFGKKTLYSGGLRIHSTLDLKMQQAGRTAIGETLRKLGHVQRQRVKPRTEIISDEMSEVWQLMSDALGLPSISDSFSASQNSFAKAFMENGLDEFQLLNLAGGNHALVNALERFNRERNTEFSTQDKVEGVLISLDYKTGEIRAMIGGSGFNADNQLNRSIQMRRQPGSAFKPIVYATAMELGAFTPASIVHDTPLLYFDQVGDYWTPENYSHSYLGPITLRRALALSRNVISVKVAETIGVQHIIDKSAQLYQIQDPGELEKRFPKGNLALALGSADVSPLEMAQAYAVFARGGKAVIPQAIKRIEDHEGNLIYDPRPEYTAQVDQLKKSGNYQIFSETTATLITSMLKTATHQGTGSAAIKGYGKTVAGKTGTTNNYRDAWYVGFNHTLVTAIWFGYDKNGLTLGFGQSGGSIAAPTFGHFYGLAQGKISDKYFGSFGPVVSKKVCKNDGLLAPNYCPENTTMDEIFAPGTEPTENCRACNTGGQIENRFSDIDENLLETDPDSNTAQPPQSNAINDDIFRID